MAHFVSLWPDGFSNNSVVETFAESLNRSRYTYFEGKNSFCDQGNPVTCIVLPRVQQVVFSFLLLLTVHTLPHCLQISLYLQTSTPFSRLHRSWRNLLSMDSSPCPYSEHGCNVRKGGRREGREEGRINKIFLWKPQSNTYVQHL